MEISIEDVAAAATKPEEGFALLAFDSKLSDLLAGSRVWRNGAAQKYPDFSLTLESVGYEVEVTRVIMDVEWNGEELPKLGLRKELLRFCSCLVAKAGNSLSGAYELVLAPHRRIRKVGSESEAKCLEYIRDTSEMPRSGRTTVLDLPGTRWSIEKIHDRKDWIYPVLQEGRAGRVCEVTADFPLVLRGRLEEKSRKKKSENKKSRSWQPCILLLVDEYPLVSLADWHQAVSEIDCHREFHTIARVGQDYDCDVLWTRNPSWLPREQL